MMCCEAIDLLYFQTLMGIAAHVKPHGGRSGAGRVTSLTADKHALMK